MTIAWFDPDAIRGDIEQSITNIFNPGAFDPLANYQPGNLVQANQVIYSCKTATTGTPPPSVEWEEVGPTYQLIYENVNTSIDTSGAIRIQISWAGTTNASIGCWEGSLRSTDGVLSCWIITPKNVGTGQGLLASSRLRRAFANWNRVSDCGKQIRMYSVNGPRTYQTRPEDDHHVHVVTCSLVAMERIQTLR